MKSHFIRRNNNVHSQSFAVKHDRLPHFLKLWHHHQELELVMILQGKGTRFIGDSIEPFGPGDLVLLGDFLPHKWQNDPSYFESRGLIAEAIIIHFEKSFLANALDQTFELKGLSSMIQASSRGIDFRGKVKKEAGERLWKILRTPPGLERLILLLNLLKVLSEEKDITYIASQGYAQTARETDIKLKKANDYIMNHFQSDIRLGDVAELLNMNKAAFCRYFKKATEKNFSAYLNEIRIGFACKMLQSGDSKSVAEICYESGFNNLSNFNQRFKKLTGYSPTNYIKLSK